ncbi:MAG: hypothetical protein ACLQK4_11585 [Acidimicrobiales bacterium]|jgi:hypothetical protein
MSQSFGRRDEAQPGLLGEFLTEETLTAPAPIPARRPNPPKLWGSIELEGDEVAVRLSGWRSVWAMKRRLAVPLSEVVSVEHDPAARLHIQAKLRHRSGQTGVFRVGPYHSLQGWSFWSIGLGRNAVVIESSGPRYRFLVVEVEDPASTVDEIRRAAGLAPRPPGASRSEQPST